MVSFLHVFALERDLPLFISPDMDATVHIYLISSTL